MASKISFLFICFSIVGCASISHDHPTLKLIPESEYYSRIERNTMKSEHYNGLMNVLTYSATVVTNDLADAQVDQQARIFQFNDTQYKNEKGKIQSDLTKKTEIFLSFYVPEKKYDDLAKKTSKWKIFLDVAGQRYEAKVVKMRNQLAELQSLYPAHTRWSTPYKLSFPVSTAVVENGAPKLTITGPLTSSTVNFNSKK